ncbi:MAG: hypothetical protein HQ522_05735 [Bacteroidetes bacterium]|nr:hypothetical protein [Bacteroidota bacterium]
MYQENNPPPPLSLKFSVTGKPVVIINDIDRGLALRIYIERALKESASARPMEDYDAFFNSIKLDWGEKTASFNFPANAVIMLSLKIAQGADRAHVYGGNLYRRTIYKIICYSNLLTNRKISR